MAQNENPWVTELLSWQGHDRGGVHVPFQRTRKPLSTIETGLVIRLRALASSIAAGDSSVPRWIFLVGGPGNGKSETVQDFLSSLDQSLGMQGALIQLLTQSFAPHPFVRRRVTVNSSDVAHAPGTFGTYVKQLIIVQDATATEDALGNAARQLADDIADLLTSPGNAPPIFIACANRGLLTRALREAYSEWGKESDVVKQLTEVIRASSLGNEVLGEQRRSCWPISTDKRIACWPLDFESLLIPNSTGKNPIQQIFEAATDTREWEIAGRCLDCDAGAVCPFRQNAAWIRKDVNAAGLLTILRRGELATGQHWNFRDTFSLAAEIMVGQWSDFGNADHPCKWVHQQASSLSNSPAPRSVAPTYFLLRRLYPHALFRVELWRNLVEKYKGDLTQEHPLSASIIDVLSNDAISTSKSIREKLSEDYSKLDPAIYTPSMPEDRLASMPGGLLRGIEENYSQSIELGRDMPIMQDIAEMEKRFLQILDAAEREWYRDLLSRKSVQAFRFTRFLRRVAAITAKRSLGVRAGRHAYERYLKDFAESLHEIGKLSNLADAIIPLLGQDKFRFNLVESFGQPRAEAAQDGLVVLVDEIPGIRFVPASKGEAEFPGHDIPCLVISGKYRVAITFEFYLALRLRSEGCASSSLPASVRAAVDRIRHLYAGDLCKQNDRIIDNRARIFIGGKFKVNLDDNNAEPSIIEI